MKELQDTLREARSLPNEFTARWRRSFGLPARVIRRPGARLLVRQDGKSIASIGAISGGCFGGEVVLRARAVLDSGAAQLIALDTRALFGLRRTDRLLIERLPPFSENIAQQLVHSLPAGKHWRSRPFFKQLRPTICTLGLIATSSEDRCLARSLG